MYIFLNNLTKFNFGWEEYLCPLRSWARAWHLYLDTSLIISWNNLMSLMLSALLARTPDSLLWNLSPSRLINEAAITILAKIPDAVLELALRLLTARETGSSKCHHPHHLQLNIFIWEKRHQVTSYSHREIWALCLTWNALKISAFKSRRFINNSEDFKVRLLITLTSFSCLKTRMGN